MAQRLRKFITSYNWKSRTSNPVALASFSYLFLGSANLLVALLKRILQFGGIARQYAEEGIDYSVLLPSKSPPTCSEFDHLGILTVSGGME